MFQGFDDLIRGLGKAVMIATVAYVVIKWGVPMLVEQTSKKKSRRAYA
jgi:hypothetical protein